MTEISCLVVDLIYGLVQSHIVMIFVTINFLTAPMCFCYGTKKKELYLSARSRRDVGDASLPPTFLCLGFVSFFDCIGFEK